MAEYFVSKHKIATLDNLPFDPSDYSRFKYGSAKVAVQYGQETANAFLEEFVRGKSISPLVVFCSPAVYLPTASDALMRVFISSIQAELGPQSIRPEVIKRRESHLEDYGSMTEAERNNLLGTDSFILDPQVIHEHEVVVAIDDIKITGTHEKRMRGVFQNNGILNDIVYTTYAELVSTDVHPRFESYINEFSIQTLADLQSILSDPMDQFILNTRVAKLMLKQPFEQFKVFIRRQSEQFCRDLLDGAIGSGYESEPLLAVNLAYLRDFVQTSSLIDA